MKAKGDNRLSEVFKNMAQSVMANSEAVPTSEAAAAALLLAHVAWQRSLGDCIQQGAYREVLREMEKENGDLWLELKSSDPEMIITDLVFYKRQHHSGDIRRGQHKKGSRLDIRHLGLTRWGEGERMGA